MKRFKFVTINIGTKLS